MPVTAASNSAPARSANTGNSLDAIAAWQLEVTADGETYQANFVKIAVNVMTRGASDENVLPDLMRKWFGPNAGSPGTSFQVAFERSADGYILTPATKVDLNLVLLFVTLDKSDMQEEHRYEDAFVSPTRFRWQSQNRTSRDSSAGQRLKNHRTDRTQIHLFVRPVAKVSGKTQQFMYCGQLEFERWQGDRPISVWWKLATAVPASHHDTLRIQSPE